MKNQDFDKLSPRIINKLNPNSVKIVFFGTSDFAVPALKSLANWGYKIDLVITQPEKPVGRKKKVMLPILSPILSEEQNRGSSISQSNIKYLIEIGTSPVKKTAQELNLKVIEPHNLKRDEEFFEKFKDLNPDICIIASYGKIIPDTYLEIPKYGFINIHPSLLPKYRGPSPIQTSILNGDEETGVVIMKIDEKMDHGPILASSKFKVESLKYYKEIEKELADLGAELLIDVLPKYINDEVELKEQDHSKATFTKKFSREDGKIDWSKSAKEIYNQIRALNPEPGTWTTFNGKTLNIKKVPILSPILSEEQNRGSSISHLNSKNLGEIGTNIGTVVKLDKKIAVKTADGYLVLETVQLEGKKEMDVQSFINGQKDFVGVVLG